MRGFFWHLKSFAGEGVIKKFSILPDKSSRDLCFSYLPLLRLGGLGYKFVKALVSVRFCKIRGN